MEDDYKDTGEDVSGRSIKWIWVVIFGILAFVGGQVAIHAINVLASLR